MNKDNPQPAEHGNKFYTTAMLRRDELLNLLLQYAKKRSDGYHEMVMPLSATGKIINIIEPEPGKYEERDAYIAIMIRLMSERGIRSVDDACLIDNVDTYSFKKD